MSNLEQAITACAFIHRQDDGKVQLFTAKRADTKSFFPGKFELPGGHTEPQDKTLEETLLREIDEEFRLRIIVGSIYHAFLYRNEKRGTQSIEVVYFATMPLDEHDREQKIVFNPEDHSEYRWVTKDEALELWAKGDMERMAVIEGFEILERSSEDLRDVNR